MNAEKKGSAADMLKIGTKRRRTVKQIKKERADKAKEQIKIKEALERGRRME